jgi:hypothetical protein
VLAIATVGAVAMDHIEGERQKRERADDAKRHREEQAADGASQP